VAAGHLARRIARLRQNPKHVRFQELQAVLEAAGFSLRRVRGSHYYYKRAEELVGIVKPHGGRKYCAPQDVKDVLHYLQREVNPGEEAS